MREILRKIPKVDSILRSERWRELQQYPEDLAKNHLREVLEEVRDAIRTGTIDSPPTLDDIINETSRRTARTVSPALRRVINGTGVVIHTNLGRAPLAPSAIDRMVAVASGYSNLEYNLEKGERGDRHTHAVSLLTRLTGAESAVVVNNNAAAVLLVLNTLAEGKEVVIGRGEFIEIGGSFRIPEVMKKSGAILREVGTTNRTFAEDYEAGNQREHRPHHEGAHKQLPDQGLCARGNERRAVGSGGEISGSLLFRYGKRPCVRPRRRHR